MLVIDGAAGEGGGQVLRTSLALSMITGIPFRIENIRAGRRRPGLMRQHLTGLNAAATICGARVEGGHLKSTEVEFFPGEVVAGEYLFEMPTAGSTTLVLQAVLPALMLASEPSSVVCTGGTHNPMAPTVEFLQRVFVPQLRKMGVGLEVECVRPGFYPAGGGSIRASITPCERSALKTLTLHQRGSLVKRRAVSVLSDLPHEVGTREVQSAHKRLQWEQDELHVEHVEATCAGNVFFLESQWEHVTWMFTAFGSKGISAERVAGGAIAGFRKVRDTQVVVGEHLSDQLLLPMALANTSGSFLCAEPSGHLSTQAQLIPKFLEVDIDLQETTEPGIWRVDVLI